MASNFVVLLSGQIETAVFTSVRDLYCKYSYVYGSEWTQVAGLHEGISAICERSARGGGEIVIALPIEATFTSTNPFRWPQIVLSCYGSDSFGNDIVRGYGAMRIPTVPGRSTRRVAMFVPESSSLLQKFFAWITGKRAEFIDPRIVASAEGRQVTRVRSQGIVNITMSVVFKDFKGFGFDVMPTTVSQVSEFPLPVFETKLSTQPSAPQEVDKGGRAAVKVEETAERPRKEEEGGGPSTSEGPSTSSQPRTSEGPSTRSAARPLPLPRTLYRDRDEDLIEDMEEVQDVSSPG